MGDGISLTSILAYLVSLNQVNIQDIEVSFSYCLAA